MTNGEHDGFTIIEVTLFLAISALLLIIAFAFTGTTLRNVRFTDATKSLQGFFQQQYTRVQTNSVALSVPSGGSPGCTASGAYTYPSGGTSNVGASSTCILLGSALDFAADGKSITVSPVIGFAGSSSSKLSDTNPLVFTQAAETHTFLWQVTVSKKQMRNSINNSGTGNNFNFNQMLFLRDPQTGNINYYVNTGFANIQGLLAQVESDTTYQNPPTLVCIQSEDSGTMRGAIKFDGKGGQAYQKSHTGVQGVSIDAITSSVVSQSDVFFGGLTCGA